MKLTTAGESMIPEAAPCRGLIFKVEISTWYDDTNQRLNQRTSLRLLKGKSCSGCENCGGTWDSLTDELHYLGKDTAVFDALRHGHTYCAVYCPDLPDFESGISEGGYWQMMEVKEDE